MYVFMLRDFYGKVKKKIYNNNNDNETGVPPSIYIRTSDNSSSRYYIILYYYYSFQNILKTTIITVRFSIGTDNINIIMFLINYTESIILITANRQPGSSVS